MRFRCPAVAALVLAVACSDEPSDPDGGAPVDSGPARDAGADAGFSDAAVDAGPDVGVDAGADAGAPQDRFTITVTLDGAPAAGVRVVQGGVFDRGWVTDAAGVVEVEIDRSVRGDIFVMASHPEARIRGVDPDLDPKPLEIALERYDPSDNPDYVFNAPGVPGDREDTSKCGHCHRTTDDQWVASPHASAAKNPIVQDLYAGVASGLTSEAACTAAGGRWLEGLEPGTRQAAFRCYLGEGYLPNRNPDCVDTPCDAVATDLGNCADCHAPGIDGEVGGRGLLEATGTAFEAGVHCDVCHHVESVDLARPPGVAGALAIVRPSEEGSGALGAGGWLPLTFGPSPDSPNIRMGSVQRDHFREARFCGGCHELSQHDFPPGQAADPGRWPSGSIPVQSTYSEWQAGALADVAPCQSCHMPPDPKAGNHGDIQIYEQPIVGITGGWYRPAGSMRKHTWYGPRQPDSRMLELAAALFVDARVDNGRLTVEVRAKNVGAGHAIPTGEPLRHIMLEVTARCGGAPLRPLGGAVVPDYGGYRARRVAGEDWDVWPEAQVGDRLRVVAQPGGFVDYEGVGPFGDGTFDAAGKGLPVQTYVGEVTITAVSAAGAVTLDGPRPVGDVAYLVRGEDDWAGRPGFGFARVLASADGRRMVPHFAATDVVSDNRLMPQASFRTTHELEATCADPEVVARLVYRRYPARMARARGWALETQPMVEVRR